MSYIAERGFKLRGVAYAPGATVPTAGMSEAEVDRHVVAGRIKEYEADPATDAAARKAAELGLDISTIQGSGENGRVTVGDVQKAAKEQGEA